MPVTKDVKNDIIDVLEHVKKFLEEGDSKKILEWSDHIIHSASIYQDEYTLTLAVMVYSLGKIMEIRRLKENEKTYGNLCIKCGMDIDSAINYAKNEEWDKYLTSLENMIKKISNIGRDYNTHLQYVLNAAKIKKGNKMFLHGISIGRVAETLGITKWDLMAYIGQTSESEYYKFNHASLKHKFKIAKEAFE